MFIKKNKNGFSLVELLVAISFVSVIITAILTMNSFNASLWKANEDKTKAYFYASESLEAMKLISWSSLNNGDYHLVLQNNAWTLVSGEETLENKYTRNINISSVQREFNINGHVYGDIVASGFADPDSKKIIVTISWPDKKGNIKTLSLDNYLSRWQAERFTQTDWSGGSGQDTWSDATKFYNKTSGLENNIEGISTLVSGFLDWNNATPTSTFSLSSTYDANDIYVNGNYAYMVTENNSSGSELYILNIADPKNPSQISSLNISSAVTAVVVQDNYAYLATRGDSTELRVVNVSNINNPSIVATINLSGNSDALDVGVNNTKLYAVQGNTLHAFDISTPTSPQALDTIDLNGLGKKLFISANNIFVATQNTNQELQIIDGTNSANLQNIGGADLPGSLSGTDVFVLGSRAYISTDNNGSGAGGGEFFVYDISNFSLPISLGYYDVGAKVYAFNVVGPYAILATNLSNQELKIVDVSFPATISSVTSFDLSGYILGLSANCSFIYAASASNNEELIIISTGVTDCYATSGQLESSTFDTGATNVTYNWLAWSGSQPVNTTIRFQLATSNNSNGPWNYVGPDGSSSSYYTTAAKEFINYNNHLNQRYFRYKLFLNSQSDFQAPALEEFILSYSPNQ